MNYRAFQEKDLDELHGMICSTIDKNYRDVYSPGSVSYFKEYHSIANISADASLGHTILALDNGSIVGSGTLLGNNVRRVFVRPDRQGKGIGGSIMNELEQIAAKDQIELLELDSSMVSVDFYHRLGYVGDQQEFIELGDGDRLNYVPYDE